jgi:hypothetical protein
MKDAPEGFTMKPDYEDEDTWEEPIWRGCCAWIYQDEFDEGFFCSRSVGPGDRLCRVHRRMFDQTPQAEQFIHLEPGTRQTLEDLATGSQRRLLPADFFTRRRRVRSWLTEIDALFDRRESWELQEATEAFNQEHDTQFTTRQFAQGLKTLCDRGTVQRSRPTVKGERLTIYSRT